VVERRDGLRARPSVDHPRHLHGARAFRVPRTRQRLPGAGPVVGLYENRLVVYRTADLSTPAATIKNDSKKDFTGAAFHPGGRVLAATSNDKTVKFSDTTTWQQVGGFDWKVGRLRSIAFSADGSLAAAGGDKGQIVVWDVDL
jgi:WD40 repeat protein